MSDSRDDKNDYTVFQKYCEKAIGQLSEECIQSFKETTDEGSRIVLLYQAATKIPITIIELNGKNFEVSQEQKTKGNSYFAKKDYANALKAYNEGIIKCPQNTDESRELLSILISNRSATYFELKEYKKVFNDIDYVLEIGNYPAHLKYKIWIRKAKCYDALQNERLSSEAYDEALKSLKFSKLDERSIETKINEIEKARDTKIEFATKNELVPVDEAEVFEGDNEYIAAHFKVKFQQDAYQGRYAIAEDNIEAGTIIVEENAHCAVVDTKHALTNCQYCFTAVEQLVACPTCSNVVFCSTICERLANKTFHKIECPIQASLYSSGASVNCFLALRIVSQKHFSYFNDKKNKLKDYLNDHCKKNIIKKKTYRYDDYDNVFFLCRNEANRKREELLHFSCMAIFLLRLLKFAKYFPFETVDETLKDDEVYFGSLLLRHLQLLQFNAHEVSELRNIDKSHEFEDLMTKYENAAIGAGLYPTLALFNHSCDPSIVRYNIKSKMVVRTIKPIKAGEIIYENYGPLYTSTQMEERQKILQNNYWFECLCTPCVERWPMYKEMKENELRIPCKTPRCPFVFLLEGDDDPYFTCEFCKSINCILPNLKGLMVLDEILPEAENLFKLGQLQAAMKKFISGLEILFKFTKPPHPEIIKVQQRIRSCMVHLGNKAFDYKTDLL
ncbi:unnamed protein product [Phyllotreta striolata]|uniref:Protein-lysine N-methyltransferase SMYD4 n=1 Tax=Phyllotreta striolata TaxID=444603 RepID=A0A9N9TG37_PHYSR|nr:unnamed protein product [Phyllotreta striolata]